MSRTWWFIIYWQLVTLKKIISIGNCLPLNSDMILTRLWISKIVILFIFSWINLALNLLYVYILLAMFLNLLFVWILLAMSLYVIFYNSIQRDKNHSFHGQLTSLVMYWFIYLFVYQFPIFFCRVLFWIALFRISFLFLVNSSIIFLKRSASKLKRWLKKIKSRLKNVRKELIL